MEPSKGRIVNYHCIQGEQYLGCGEDMVLPAMIVATLTGPMRGVNLIVFTNNPSGFTLRTAVPYGLNHGGWSWPIIHKDEPAATLNKDASKVVSTVAMPKVG